MLIHDSATGIKELKFDLEARKAQNLMQPSGKRREYLAVVDAITPPMNAQVPCPNDRTEMTMNHDHRWERFLILHAKKC